MWEENVVIGCYWSEGLIRDDVEGLRTRNLFVLRSALYPTRCVGGTVEVLLSLLLLLVAWLYLRCMNGEFSSVWAHTAQSRNEKPLTGSCPYGFVGQKGSPFGKESSWLRIRTQDHRLATAVTIPNELTSGLAAGSARTNTWIIVSLPVSSVCSSRLSRSCGGSGFDHRTGSSCSATKLSLRESAWTPLVNIPWRRKFSQVSMYTYVQFFNSNETYEPASATFHLLLLSMLLIGALSLLEQSKKKKSRIHCSFRRTHLTDDLHSWSVFEARAVLAVPPQSKNHSRYQRSAAVTVQDWCITSLVTPANGHIDLTKLPSHYHANFTFFFILLLHTMLRFHLYYTEAR